jgi:hypothetical protein
MDTRSLHNGDLIQCKVKGREFAATYLQPTANGRHAISPQTRNVSHFHITARQIEKKLDRQEQLEVRG